MANQHGVDNMTNGQLWLLRCAGWQHEQTVCTAHAEQPTGALAAGCACSKAPVRGIKGEDGAVVLGPSVQTDGKVKLGTDDWRSSRAASRQLPHCRHNIQVKCDER